MQSSFDFSGQRENPAARRPGRLALVHFLVMLVTLAAILVACATEKQVARTNASDEASPAPSATYKSKQTAKWSENNIYRP
jgi:hypothetical protein